eukprot:1126137-Prymnesium_polylepis.1
MGCAGMRNRSSLCEDSDSAVIADEAAISGAGQCLAAAPTPRTTSGRCVASMAGSALDRYQCHGCVP